MKHLIIGGGSIGKRHLRNLYELGEKEIFCYKRVYNGDFEKEFHCKVITSYSELQTLKPHILYVCNPTSLHHEAITWAQQLGCHIFMEKPLTHDEQLLRSICQQWKNEHVFFIGFVLRYHPLLKKLKEKLDEKAIGDVFSARFEFGSYLPDWHPGENVGKSYAGVKALGGGVINTATHELDLMLFLLGIPSSVLAAKANLDHLHLDVEEIAEAIFQYQWGLVTLHLDFLKKIYERKIKILGTLGELIINWPKNQLLVKKYDQPEEILEGKSDINQMYLDELKDFLYLVKTNSIKHPLDFECAIINTKWMLSMHKSAEIQWERSLTGSLI